MAQDHLEKMTQDHLEEMDQDHLKETDLGHFQEETSRILLIKIQLKKINLALS